MCLSISFGSMSDAVAKCKMKQNTYQSQFQLSIDVTYVFISIKSLFITECGYDLDT